MMNLYKAQYHVVQGNGFGGILEVSKSKVYHVEETAATVLSCLDSVNTYDELLDALPSNIQKEEVDLVLEWGMQRGMVSLNPGSVTSTTIPLAAPVPSPQVMFLMVTPDCNMACDYCYTRSTPFRQSPEMSIDVARRAIKYFASYSTDLYNVIRFHGGEPTLNWSLVEDAVIYAQNLFDSLGKNVSFGITTNGLCLNTEMVEFIKRHSISVNISVDGPSIIHDRHRLDPAGDGTHGRVVNNLILLRDELGSLLEVNSVLQPGTRLRYVYDYFSGLAVSSINPIAVQGKANPFRRNDAAEYVSDLGLIGAQIANEVRAGRTPSVIQPLTDYCRRMFHEYLFPSHCRGGWAEIAVDADGSIYPCYQLVGVDSFKLGNLGDCFAQSQGRELLRKVFIENREQCANCWARYLCGGGCWARNWWDGGAFEVTSDVFCELHRGEIEVSILLLATALLDLDQKSDPSLLAYLVEPQLSRHLVGMLDELKEG